MAATKKGIRVRMYRIGFGDCFLVSFPDGEKDHHVLVDCGVHAKGNIATLPQIMAQLATDTGGELAAVVATHEHQDHIAGFGTHAAEFRQLKVGEVWMPWTSNTEDPEAMKLRKKHQAALQQLRMHFGARGAPADVQAILSNLAPNRTALDLLRGGFDGKATPRFLQAGDVLKNAAGVEGLTVRVLAPPRDVSGLSRMDPPKSERFLRGAGAVRNQRGSIEPFPRYFRVTKPKTRLSKKEQALFHDQLLMESLAFTIDSAVNNTSLVLAMTYHGHTLLFPGDAQWGNWQSWIGTPEATALLGSIEFLKVAHHGSHNASPKSAVAAMPLGGFAAMASTQSTPWKSIPQGKLMDALMTRSKKKVVRSDSLPIAKAPKGPPFPKTLPKGFKKGTFWIDYTIPL